LSASGNTRDYLDVVLAAPVTVPYVRYSTRSAHWFVAQALVRLLKESSGIVALRRALRAVQAGDAEVVACIGADTNHVDSFRQALSSFSVFARDAVFPYGSGGPNASFAFLTSYYMRMYGATREDFGKLCVAQRDNALGYKHAMFKKKLTMEDYLDARLIADPIRLFDCVMPCAGAEAFLVMTRQRARALGLPYVIVRSTCERHNAFPDDPIQTRGGWVLDREHLYGAAGVEPSDIDFVETYDDYPVMSLIQIEDLGFCAKGEGPEFIRRHSFTTEGSFPINTSGGQLSAGQAGCAAGFLGLVEAVGFGMITYDRGLCSGAAILGRADA
jgi:acetyl-CoA acetyltransferase